MNISALTMNAAELAERYHETHGSFKQAHEEIEALIVAAQNAAGPNVRYLLNESPDSCVLTVYGPQVCGDPAKYVFDNLAEALQYLADRLIPTDSELLDKLDAIAPHGFRQGYREGLIPCSRMESDSRFCKESLSAGRPVREILTNLLAAMQNGSFCLED